MRIFARNAIHLCTSLEKTLPKLFSSFKLFALWIIIWRSWKFHFTGVIFNPRERKIIWFNYRESKQLSHMIWKFDCTLKKVLAQKFILEFHRNHTTNSLLPLDFQKNLTYSRSKILESCTWLFRFFHIFGSKNSYILSFIYEKKRQQNFEIAWRNAACLPSKSSTGLWLNMHQRLADGLGQSYDDYL